MVDSVSSAYALLPWQLEQKERLVAQFDAGKVPHAFMFCGLEGLGKSSFAEFISAYLLCEQPHRSMAPCQTCKQCKLIDSDSHPDFKQLAPEEGSASIKVDQVRQLVDFFAKSSQQGGRKIAIVSPAESLNHNAANALLKTLEEPSKSSVIILISHQPGMLLPTIRSRCQVVDFSSPSATTSLQWLEQQCKERFEEDAWSEKKLSDSLRLANFSPLKALNYLEIGALEEYQLMLNELGSYLKNETLSTTLATRWNDDVADLRVAWMAKWLEVILKIKLESFNENESIADKMFTYLSQKSSYEELFALYTFCLSQYRLFLGKTNPNKILAFESLLHKWSSLMRKS